MATLNNRRPMSGIAARYGLRVADLDDLAGLPGVTKLVKMEPDFVTTAAGSITRVENLANASDPFTQVLAGKSPTYETDAQLARPTATFGAGQDQYMQSAAPFDWSGPFTVGVVGRVAEVDGDIFQSVVGDFAGSTPNTASLVVQSSGGINRMVHRIGTLPGGASYARAEYEGGSLFFAMIVSNGISRSGFSLNGGAFGYQTISTMPGVGVTDFLLGHSIANSSFDGALEFCIGVQGADWSGAGHEERLATLKAHVRGAYGSFLTG